MRRIDDGAAASLEDHRIQPGFDEDFHILAFEPPPPRLMERLEKIGPFHKIWLEKDPAAAIAKIAPRVRAVIAGWKKLDDEKLNFFPNLSLIACHSVGYDHVDVEWARAHGVIVTNTPDVLTDDVADLAIGLLLAAVRRIPQADRFLRAGAWREDAAFPLTGSLRNKTLGIMGLGRIGRAIAERAEAFGLKIIYHSRTPLRHCAYPYYDDLEDMARACDFLMLSASGGPSSKGAVNAEVLRALGAQGVLINIARGSIVDQQALAAALRDETILSAALDVYADEPCAPKDLIDAPQTVLTPHIASGTGQTRDRMSDLVADNVAAVARGAAPLTPIPETPWPALSERA